MGVQIRRNFYQWSALFAAIGLSASLGCKNVSSPDTAEVKARGASGGSAPGTGATGTGSLKTSGTTTPLSTSIYKWSISFKDSGQRRTLNFQRNGRDVTSTGGILTNSRRGAFIYRGEWDCAKALWFADRKADVSSVKGTCNVTLKMKRGRSRGRSRGSAHWSQFEYSVQGSTIAVTPASTSCFDSTSIPKLDVHSSGGGSSGTTKDLNVKNYCDVPTQAEIDSIMGVSGSLTKASNGRRLKDFYNKPANPYVDYRKGAPGFNNGYALPGATTLAEMRRLADNYKSWKGGSGYSAMRACLHTGYSPTHWPDIAIHYYCQMGKPRYCYTFGTSGGTDRYNTFWGCVDEWKISGTKFPESRSYIGYFSPEFKDETQRLIFQYVMFGQTKAFNNMQEQNIVNAFYGVKDPKDKADCKANRTTRKEDPTDGTHCLPICGAPGVPGSFVEGVDCKVMRTALVGRGR